jgi:hypothetical protein
MFLDLRNKCNPIWSLSFMFGYHQVEHDIKFSCWVILKEITKGHCYYYLWFEHSWVDLQSSKNPKLATHTQPISPKVVVASIITKLGVRKEGVGGPPRSLFLPRGQPSLATLRIYESNCKEPHSPRASWVPISHIFQGQGLFSFFLG